MVYRKTTFMHLISFHQAPKFHLYIKGLPIWLKEVSFKDFVLNSTYVFIWIKKNWTRIHCEYVPWCNANFMNIVEKSIHTFFFERWLCYTFFWFIYMNIYIFKNQFHNTCIVSWFSWLYYFFAVVEKAFCSILLKTLLKIERLYIEVWMMRF